MDAIHFEKGDVIYENPLASEEDVRGFILEGNASVTFPNSRMRMQNLRDPSEGQAANFVFWCPEVLPDNVCISWDFRPVREPGLCIMFFAATGRNAEGMHDPALARRTGKYDQYHHGDINALHISYFRRTPKARFFQTCNLRKSYGFHMVAAAGDPLPSVEHAVPPYHIELVKCGPHVAFSINDLPILHWIDDGETYGPLLGGGKIGFRQMAPLIAEYANLTVRALRPV